MSEEPSANEGAVKRAENILKNLELTWSDLEGKRVLDSGSGPSSFLARGAQLHGSSAEVVSIDLNKYPKWNDLPQNVKAKTLQAYAEELPFRSNSFDLIIHHAAGDLLDVRDDVRVLKEGGEIRITPIAGQRMEYWFVTYYMDKILGKPPDEITRTIEEFDRQIAEADGWIPNEYIALRKKALDTLTKEQKLEVIKMLVDRYSESLQMPFECHIDDPDTNEPNGLLIYRKPNS